MVTGGSGNGRRSSAAVDKSSAGGGVAGLGAAASGMVSSRAGNSAIGGCASTAAGGGSTARWATGISGGRARTVGMNRRLILQIKFGGLGDHLFYSHLPRIAKQSGECTGVYISNHSSFRSPEYKELIWKLNPFVDGFVDRLRPGGKIPQEQEPAIVGSRNGFRLTFVPGCPRPSRYP